MSSKDRILTRLRKVAVQDREYQGPLIRDKSIFSDYQTNPDSLSGQFMARLKSLYAECYIMQTMDQLAENLAGLLKNFEPRRCVTHSFSYINHIKNNFPVLIPYLNEIDYLNILSPDFADYEVGITCADVLIARTGSILLSSSSAGGRRLSVLPPVHIVIASSDQLVPSLDEALDKLSQIKQEWSYATFITGPSRTSDIEKQLVLGAHGPKRLIMLLLQV